MKKNLFAALFASVFMFSAAANAAVDAAQAEAFVEKVTREGIEEIINANVSQTVKDQRFEKLFNNALDLNFIGQFVLGRYWRTSTPEQKKGFINAYRELNIKTWSKRFDEFKGKKFIFKGTSPSNSANQIFVNSLVPMDQGEPPKLSGVSNRPATNSKSSTSSLKTSVWLLPPATNIRLTSSRRPAA